MSAAYNRINVIHDTLQNKSTSARWVNKTIQQASTQITCASFQRTKSRQLQCHPENISTTPPSQYNPFSNHVNRKNTKNAKPFNYN